jgi:hypothetical protein
VGAVGLAAGILAPAATAANAHTSVVAVSPASSTIDLTDLVTTNDTATITAGLDANCPSALNNGGQSYGLTVNAPSFVTVAPQGATTGLHCGDAVSYLVTPNGIGTNTGTMSGDISFTPVVTNTPGKTDGIQKQVGAGSGSVTVIYTTSDCVDCGDDVGGSPAAAPAIANTYIDQNIVDANTAFLTACQAKGTNKNKSNWRGNVISYIAQDAYLMPGWVRFANFGVDAGDPSTWDAWTTAVKSEVDNYCGYHPTV